MTPSPAHRIVLDTASRMVPRVFAVLIFLAGALLLIADFAPINPSAMPLIRRWLPLVLVELSHAFAAAIGVLMLFLARGLWERIDSAWYGALGLFWTGALLSLTRELAVVPAIAMAACGLLLLPCHRAFNRRSSLLTMAVNPLWILVTVATLAAIVWTGFYLYKHIPYAHTLWGDFAYHGNASRFLRGLVIVAVTIGVFMLYRLFGIARWLPPLPDDEDADRIQEVIAGATHPQAWLALLRDKHILWNDDRTAFLMYGTSGRQWVVMGEPVGDATAAEDLAWKLKEMASLANARLSFYQVGPGVLPLMIDLDLRPYKIGEEAMIDAVHFDLSGKKGYGFRQTLKKYETLEARFEVVAPDALEAHMGRLKVVSDAWLESKNAKEKRYSLGSFDPDYMRLTPVAVVWIGGEIKAFANLWPLQSRTVLTLDLMRYHPQSPPSIMEYLFLKLIAYARDSGYASFSMGLAPLAGLEARPLSSAWPKIASVIYQLGGDIYNFQGLRAYKDKFKPRWEPRYMAVPGQEQALGAALMAVVALGNKPPTKED
ncbi:MULTISPECIES: phosphatidylglycerol lysyltransferase domain-containing protein [Asticcacaulis]|uniref:phosphatidylglycerol lysyltransferase domain-containing protein n=1 Tax=Asticcacaulis TaxID=76890 RepID=UPI001AE42735|nr:MULTISPECIES: phosphatidylglycerol lysyltransferase domain-containing protein [Asticcacaulis]MBP2158707.1 phosphatidylglycerol lysyltransferase [Asticcacaulis solisilvae]MDR6799753.1 phosphatidylglycerol lysyltransferase [Asticcacaulis sp. BE141]